MVYEHKEFADATSNTQILAQAGREAFRGAHARVLPDPWSSIRYARIEAAYYAAHEYQEDVGKNCKLAIKMEIDYLLNE
jgi:hypothetical protein